MQLSGKDTHTYTHTNIRRILSFNFFLEKKSRQVNDIQENKFKVRANNFLTMTYQ